VQPGPTANHATGRPSPGSSGVRDWTSRVPRKNWNGGPESRSRMASQAPLRGSPPQAGRQHRLADQLDKVPRLAPGAPTEAPALLT
jgi:hypothetical protein